MEPITKDFPKVLNELKTADKMNERVGKSLFFEYVCVSFVIAGVDITYSQIDNQ